MWAHLWCCRCGTDGPDQLSGQTQGEVGKEVAKLSQVIQIDKGKIQEHLGEVVRSTVE